MSGSSLELLNCWVMGNHVSQSSKDEVCRALREAIVDKRKLTFRAVEACTPESQLIFAIGLGCKENTDKVAFSRSISTCIKAGDME